MSQLSLPVDLQAEEDFTSCCVASDRGYRLGSSRVSSGDLYSPVCARLFEACGQLGHLSGVDDDSAEQRIMQAAHLTGVPEDKVRAILDARPVCWDKTGALASRVKRKARERRAMVVTRDVFNRLGEGEPLERVVSELGPQLRTLLGVAV